MKNLVKILSGLAILVAIDATVYYTILAGSVSELHLIWGCTIHLSFWGYGYLAIRRRALSSTRVLVSTSCMAILLALQDFLVYGVPVSQIVTGYSLAFLAAMIGANSA